MCKLLKFLVLACVVQGAGAQFYFTGPGFVPDENGTNLDAPQISKITPNANTGNVLKDSTEYPEMVVVPAGGFMMGFSAQEQALVEEAGLAASYASRESPQHYLRMPSFTGDAKLTGEKRQLVLPMVLLWLNTRSEGPVRPSLEAC